MRWKGPRPAAACWYAASGDSARKELFSLDVVSLPCIARSRGVLALRADEVSRDRPLEVSGVGGRGFLLSRNVFTTIDVPGATETRAFGLNDPERIRRIVGEFVDATGQRHGFLLVDGAFTTIDVPLATETRAFAVTDAGQIVGDFVDATGRRHGFLASQ
jgi:hypothetical protein